MQLEGWNPLIPLAEVAVVVAAALLIRAAIKARKRSRGNR
jgi:hypothetical protein